MTLLERIDALCKDRGMSRRKLSMVCGFSPSTISRWAESEPGYNKLEKVAAVLGVSVDYLTEGVQTNAHPSQYYLNEETKEIANAVFESSDLRLLFDNSRKMKPEDLKVLIAMQEAILRKERND